jgi:gliding motility-associated lipoprotein GldH
MKKINAFLMLTLLAILLVNCNKNRIFSEQKDIANHRWEKDQSIDFSPEIANDSISYNIYFALRHVYGFYPKEFKIKISLLCPSGNILKKSFTIPLFDKDRHPLSDCSGDYCDLETLIEKGFKFTEIGKYQFKISYDLEINSIPNIMQVGLMIDKK